jgi:PKD repeat protein
VKFFGTIEDEPFTTSMFFFIKNASLPENGTHPTDFTLISVSGQNNTFGVINDISGGSGSWEFVWDTSHITGGSLLPGSEYIFYVLNQSKNYPDRPQDGYLIFGIEVEDPIVADFSGSPTTGAAPLAVTFTDNSTNNPTSWKWSFGDGSGENASMQNPIHTYTNPDIYTVSLNATNVGGSNITTRPAYIQVTEHVIVPVAGFTTNVTSGPAPLFVQFNDTSTGSPTSWNWFFGDGNWFNTTVADERNVTYSYDTPDIYTARLTVSNDGGSSTTIPGTEITVNAAGMLPVADFTAFPVSGTAPLTVQFNDTSDVVGPLMWNWSFGDSPSSWFNTTDIAARNASYEYSTPGTYTVSLTVTNATGSNTKTRTDYISVTSGGSVPAPVADFSATPPLSGTVPLTVSFTDLSSGSPTGRAWYFGDETYSQAWTRMTASAGWSKRERHTSVVMPDGSIVLMGGAVSGVPENDVWRSADNGASWTEVNASAGWPGRWYHTSVVLPDGSIVLMGGSNGGSSYMNDVWRSTDNGATWTEVNVDAGWSGRLEHTSVVLSDGTIVLMGGEDYYGFKNDVWQSTDNGVTWTEVNANAEWPARYEHSSVALPDDSIVLMGGSDGLGNYNDVWRSTDEGETWAEVNTSAGWSARVSHTSVALPDGSIVLMGGYSSGPRMNDVWRSTDKGATWTEVNANAGWSARNEHTSVVLPDGCIVLMGGTDGVLSYLNDVWRLMPAGSSAQNPSHTYTTPGTYQVALQVYNVGGYNSIRRPGYITVTGSSEPVAGFFTNVTSGTAPLSVQFNDTSTGSPTSWNWSFGDETWFNTTVAAERNGTHSYIDSGSFTAQLTVSNDEGTDTTDPGTTITVDPAGSPPIADFTGSPISGTAPLAVQFNDTSDVVNPLMWNWSFGDSPTSWFNTTDIAARNASCEYSIPGTYTVSLTVTNATGSDTATRTDYITVTSGGSVPAPVADFSATPPHSGTAPLTVSFTDLSSGSPTGWSWFFGDENFTEPWMQVTGSAGWSGRIGHTSIAMPDGSIILMGGYDGSNRKNDVWRSMDDGATWTQINASAGWTARGYHTSVALTDGSSVLMGGWAESGDMNDVWRSTDNGATWMQVNASAGWTARYGHSCVAMPDGSIVLMGGYDNNGAKNDVWRSTDNGATWTQMTSGAEWSARDGHSSVAMPDGSILLIGGFGSGGRKNDVWRSSDNGATWSPVNVGAEWSARVNHSSVAMADGSILLMGGDYGNLNNDVWQRRDAGWQYRPDRWL